MSFHDKMFEDGFRNEQAYMDHLMNEAQKRADERRSSRQRNHEPTSTSNPKRGGRWLVEAEKFFKTFAFLDEKSESKLRDGKPLKGEAPCVAKKSEWKFLAFGLVFASDADRIRGLVDNDGMLDYGAFIESDIPCLTSSNNEEKNIVRVDDKTFESISPGDIVEVGFNLWNKDLHAIHVKGIVKKKGSDVWVP